MEDEKNREEKVVPPISKVVMPAPPNIACQGCRYAVWQTAQQSEDILVEQVFCLVLRGWTWTWEENPEEGYPVECSARQESQEK